MTLLAYGLAEAEDAYGFVAVFVTAATLRNLGRSVDYARELAGTAGQAESLAMVMVLALFGAALAGGLLAPVTWAGAVFAALVLLAVRPLATFAAFLGAATARPERLAIGYFGVRGLGSLFYAAYAANQRGLDHVPSCGRSSAHRPGVRGALRGQHRPGHAPARSAGSVRRLSVGTGPGR